MLVWEESLAWGNVESSMTDELFQKHQLQENHAMALKSINHPCVIMWGFLNECCSNLPTSRPLIKSLTEMLHNTDPTRPVTYGSHQLTSDCCLDLIDVISFNTYPGWYREGTDQFFDPTTVKTHLEELEKFASDKKYKDKALLISEIGAEAMPGLRGGHRWSEDYQADLLVYVMQYVKNSPRWSGALLWQYCDSRTYISNASQFRSAGFNFKGLVDSHRQPKEAFRRVTVLLKEYNEKNKS
jgi:beta-glucuronidase